MSKSDWYLVAGLDGCPGRAKALDAAKLLHPKLQQVVQTVVKHAAQYQVVGPLLAVRVNHKETCMCQGEVRNI